MYTRIILRQGDWILTVDVSICLHMYPKKHQAGGYRNPAVDNHRISQYLLYGPLPVSVATRMITCFRIGNPYLNISKRSKIKLLLGGPHVTNIFLKDLVVFAGGFSYRFFQQKPGHKSIMSQLQTNQRLANHHCSVKLSRLR